MTQMQTASYVHGASPAPLLGQTVGACFDDCAARFPDNDALIVPHQDIRWGVVNLTTYGRKEAVVEAFMRRPLRFSIRSSLRCETGVVSFVKSNGVACRSCCRWRRELRGNVALIQAT